MVRSKVVEVELDGKTVKVHVKEISWWEMQNIVDESTEIVNDKAKILMGRLKQNLVKRAIDKIEGVSIKNPEVLMKMLPRSEAAKVFEAVLELNPLEELMR